MKLVFHLNIHDKIDSSVVQQLLNQALSGKIYLLQESRNYQNKCDNPLFYFNVGNIKWSGKSNYINGMETLSEEHRNRLYISSLYDTVCSETGTFKNHGGDRAKLIFFLFVIVVHLNKEILNVFDMKEYIQQPFLLKLASFLGQIGSITNNDMMSEIVALKCQEAAQQIGGFPGDVTFEFVKEYCSKLIEIWSPHETEQQFIVRNTITDREFLIAENINNIVREMEITNKTSSEIPSELHVIIGAAHLMPYIKEKEEILKQLSVDNSFLNYHENIRCKRLLDFIEVEHFSQVEFSVLHKN